MDCDNQTGSWNVSRGPGPPRSHKRMNIQRGEEHYGRSAKHDLDPLSFTHPDLEQDRGIADINGPGPALERIRPQPSTGPICHLQLVVEVKGIYAGLVTIEKKCIETEEKHSLRELDRDHNRKNPMSNNRWCALIALYKTLLHEHHDFFLASQHPSASLTLRKLAKKYTMPARMWRHGIYSFLETLRHRLPNSSDHMLAFIYIAYSMVALLYETVPAFEDTWIECLGDLARYRMTIEDDDDRDREVWGGAARCWYSKAADKHPETGRLYHHLAILARPNSLQHLCRSLACISFESARSSIVTLFQPVFQRKNASQHRLRAFKVAFIKVHAHFFVHADKRHKKFSVHPLLYAADQITHDPFPDDPESLEVLSPFLIAVFRIRDWISTVYGDLKGFSNAILARILKHVTSCVSWSGILLGLCSLLPMVDAGPHYIERTAMDPSDFTDLSTLVAVGASHCGLIVAVICVARSLAKKQGHTPVYGLLMTVLAFGWWAIRGDASTTLWSLWTVLILWAVCTVQYANHACQSICTTKSAVLISTVLAIIFDLSIVRFINPTGSSVSQAELLTLSLPSLSLGLGATVVLLTAVRHNIPSTSQDALLQQQRSEHTLDPRGLEGGAAVPALGAL